MLQHSRKQTAGINNTVPELKKDCAHWKLIAKTDYLVAATSDHSDHLGAEGFKNPTKVGKSSARDPEYEKLAHNQFCKSDCLCRSVAWNLTETMHLAITADKRQFLRTRGSSIYEITASYIPKILDLEAY